MASRRAQPPRESASHMAPAGILQEEVQGGYAQLHQLHVPRAMSPESFISDASTSRCVGRGVQALVSKGGCSECVCACVRINRAMTTLEGLIAWFASACFSPEAFT